MEVRVTALEGAVAEIKADVREMRSDITSLKVDVATMKERVSHLPTKDFIVKAVVGMSGIVSAVVLFEDRLRTLFGGG